MTDSDAAKRLIFYMMLGATMVPDRRPFTPPTPETPAERVQGEAGEVAE